MPGVRWRANPPTACSRTARGKLQSAGWTAALDGGARHFSVALGSVAVADAQQRTRHGDEYPIAPRSLLPGGIPHYEAQVSIDAHDRLLAEAHRPVPALKVAPRRRAAQKPGGRRVPAMPIAAELVNVQAAVMSYAFTQLRSRRLLPE
jgi:hypothetical protein